MKKNYYQNLHVDPNADVEIIEVAYKRLARKYHPDTSAVCCVLSYLFAIGGLIILLDSEAKALFDKPTGESNIKPKKKSKPHFNFSLPKHFAIIFSRD